MLKVVAKNYADPQKIGDILALARDLVAETRSQPGCISYGLYQDTQHPELLTMIEEWESPEALNAHLHSDIFTRIAPRMGAMMTRAADMNVYQQVL